MHMRGGDLPRHDGGIENVPAIELQQDDHRQAQFQDLGERTMNFQRIVGGSFDSRETHKSQYYILGFARMVSRHFSDITSLEKFGKHKPLIADPFARNCDWATHTNDIDPSTKADSHMDALEWLKTLETQSFDLVLFDPPFSKRQAEEKYEAGHVNIYTDSNYVSKSWGEIARILKPGGRALKLGYNSSRHSPVFELEQGWVVNFGASRNDVIMTLWQKRQTRIDDYWISDKERRGME
jgi:hypothetical protein